jgi:hypothetical protein
MTGDMLLVSIALSEALFSNRTNVLPIFFSIFFYFLFFSIRSYSLFWYHLDFSNGHQIAWLSRRCLYSRYEWYICKFHVLLNG